MLFEINGGRHVPLRDDAVVFSVATEAHPPRQFEVQFRLRAKVMSVLHAPAPVVCVFDLGEQDAARLPLLTCDGEQCGSGGCGAGYSPGSLGHAFKQTHSRPYGSRHSREFMMTRQWEVEMRFAVSLHEKNRRSKQSGPVRPILLSRSLPDDTRISLQRYERLAGVDPFLQLFDADVIQRLAAGAGRKQRARDVDHVA